MTWWARVRSFWRNVLYRSDMERNMSDELQFHLERRVEDLMWRRRLTAREAMRIARLEFGSMEKCKEEVRQSLGLKLLDESRGDLRYAVRTLARRKGFTAAAVATLGLAIGANTAVFSVVDALLLRELPVSNPGQLVVFDFLRTQDSMIAGYSGYGRPGPIAGTTVRTSFSPLTVERFQQLTATFSDVFAFSPAGTLNLAVDRQSETASGLFVTGNYYRALGVSAVAGRTLAPSDDRPGADPVAVISHRYWQRRFAGDPRAVGTVVAVNRVPVSIVGVTPQGFDGVHSSKSSDITLPIALAASLNAAGENRRSWPVWMWSLEMMARLQPGVARESALAGVLPVFVESVRESWAARPQDTPNPTRQGVPQLRVQRGARGPDGPRIDAQQVLSGVFAVVAAVWLIGCVNLATLFLVRASARRHEVFVRLTLGASRQRVIRQLLTESLVLALAGGFAGAVLAWWGRNFMLWFPTHDTPVVDPRLDLRVLGFAAVLSAITAVAFGIGPALRATRSDPGPALKRSTTRGVPARGLTTPVLLAVQIAVSIVLLAGAALFVRTVYNLSRVDVGFAVDNLLVFRINPAVSADDEPRAFALYERLVASIESVPGVRSATLSAMPLFAGGEWEMPVRPDGVTEPHDALIQMVRFNFFDTIGIPIRAGRALSAADGQSRPRVAVINETMAREIFADSNPVGRRFQFERGPFRGGPVEVVGVAQDTKYSSLLRQISPMLFLPYTQAPAGEMTVEVRTALEPLELAPAIRAAVAQVDASLPVVNLKTERAQIADTTEKPRAFAVLTTAAGVLGLLLACVGLYGMASYDAARRTSEIGLRMALGAQRFDILRLVMRETVIVVAIGAAIGSAVVVGAGRVIGSLLFGVAPGDPLAIGAALAVLAGVALCASYLPARRASRLDPTQALRYE